MYNELPYFSLKQECKKQGLNPVGKKEELLNRLNGTEITEEVPELPITPIQKDGVVTDTVEHVAKPTIRPATSEELARFLPNTTFTPKIDTSKYTPWLTNERLEALENKIAPIAAGKGSFRFDINHKGAAYQCEFFGGASGPECTTLIDTDNQIVARARHYFNARMAKGTNGQVSRV